MKKTNLLKVRITGTYRTRQSFGEYFDLIADLPETFTINEVSDLILKKYRPDDDCFTVKHIEVLCKL